MTTIPLATVVSYLRRKGVDLACLEGAPIMVGSDMQVLGPFYLREITRCKGAPPDFVLYLGTDAICPAAMGWASAVVSAARGRLVALTWCEGHGLGIVGLLAIDVDHPTMRSTICAGGPATPAARLLAVLDYEMGRAP